MIIRSCSKKICVNNGNTCPSICQHLFNVRTMMAVYEHQEMWLQLGVDSQTQGLGV